MFVCVHTPSMIKRCFYYHDVSAFTAIDCKSEKQHHCLLLIMNALKQLLQMFKATLNSE